VADDECSQEKLRGFSDMLALAFGILPSANGFRGNTKKGGEVSARKSEVLSEETNFGWL
jgi:hypothetical protein